MEKYLYTKYKDTNGNSNESPKKMNTKIGGNIGDDARLFFYFVLLLYFGNPGFPIWFRDFLKIFAIYKGRKRF